ncbi:spore germination protein [Paenibacillus pasadenensis]|uniref:spore germination protein n=1 Tax=Paenibacillus pasadenensis TaxID=217090 RepID=UPI002040770E|nr:spore germination protein [Paenibacillus pasadenensis]MCM3746763.1 spore germination protein [Paenibacillus pasadenensis]
MIQAIHERFANAKDVKTHRMTNSRFIAEVAYIATLVDESKVSEFILVPFAKEEVPFNDLLDRNPNFTELDDSARWTDVMLRGFVLIKLESKIYTMDAARVIRNANPLTSVESTIEGPQIALSEDLLDSVNIIRSRYASPNLQSEEFTVGSISKTRVVMVYDHIRVDPTVLDMVRLKLRSIQTDVLSATGELAKFMNDNRKRLFPVEMITERVDRLTRGLSKGKIIVMMQGSMFAIMLPIMFTELMTATEDRYESFWTSVMLLSLRFVALLMTTTLPALYIAVISYNPELFRVQLAFSIAGSRASVPYPSFIEVFIMLFMIEMLVEASVRLPKYIGSTATTVGGLILGQAAQQAGLVSSIMIIVTSVMAISNFVIPIYSLSLAVRFIKYPLIVLAIFFGLPGVACGIFAGVIYLCSQRSFGKPYFRLMLPIDWKHTDIGEVKSK